METRTAFLMGGPKDGEWLALPGPMPSVAFAEPTTTPLRWVENESPVTEVGIKTRLYIAERISVFGVFITAYFIEGLSIEEKQALAVKHLLSDTAKRLGAAA